MSDILAIKRMLADRAPEIAALLLPNGRREGHEWRAGSTSGERGKSLGVHLTGAKAGTWCDFADGEQSGDLIDLWCTVRDRKLTEALDDIRAYLGVTRPQPYRDPRPAFRRPTRPKCAAPQARVLDYLKEDRNIPRDVIDRYKIGEDGNKIVFPFLLPDGELALVKTRVAADGEKPKTTEADCEAVLFGWQAIGDSERILVLTEGEIDALSMAAYGFPAMSVPYGGGGKGKQNWIENEFDRLERFEKIYLATDMDEQGELAAVEIASRLGRHRCYRVTLPRKDANACLVEGVSREEIAQAIATAATLDPEGLRRSSEYLADVTNLFYPPRDQPIGYSMPYSGLRGQMIFGAAEATIWSGPTGSGKTMVICDCVPYWVQQGSRICIASLEMHPKWTLKRLVKQAGGVDRPTTAYLAEVVNWLDPGVLFYEKVGKSGVDPLLEVFDYALAKYGCDQFILDSLMRLGIPSDDYVGQEQAVFKMVDWAITRKVHLHLVVHSRKGAEGRHVPESEDIKGASEIGANAFNIITIWRNRAAEEAGDGSNMDGRPEFTEKPGVVVNVAKQRNGDFEGKVQMYFSTKTYQYFSVGDNRRFARSYVEIDRAKTA